MRGLAGAVVCETWDLGIKWPQWHTLLFEGQGAERMRVVYPQDCEEDASETSQDGLLEEMGSQVQAISRRKTNDSRTEKHRNVVRKSLVEGGWVQKILYDIGWSKEKGVMAVTKKAQGDTGCTTVRS